MMDLGRPLRFPRNDLGIPPRSFVYSGQPNPLLGFVPHLYRGGMLAVGHDFQPGMHAGVVPGGAFQAGKFTGEEPTPGGPTQQGAAAQGAGAGTEAEGPTPGGGIVSSADQAFSTAKSIVQAAKAVTSSEPTTTSAPTAAGAPAASTETGTAPATESQAPSYTLVEPKTTSAPAPETRPQPPLGTPEPEEAFPGASMTPTARLSQPIGAPQTRPQPPMGVPEPEEAMPGATINLGSPMNLGAPPQVPAVTPTETTTQLKQNELPQMGAGAAGAAAAGAGIAAGTSAPGAPTPVSPGSAAIGSMAGPITPTAPAVPGPEGIEFSSSARATSPAPTGLEATGELTGETGPGGTVGETALTGAGAGLNLGSGVFDLIRGNIPAGVGNLIQGAGGVNSLVNQGPSRTGTVLSTAGGLLNLEEGIRGGQPAQAVGGGLSLAGTAANELGSTAAGNIIAGAVPFVNLGLAAGTKNPGLGTSVGPEIAKEILGRSGGLGASAQTFSTPALEAAANSIEGQVAGEAGATAAEAGAGAGASGSSAGASAGGTVSGAAGGLAAGAASAILAIVPIIAQWWGGERDAAKVAWDMKEAKKQLTAFQADQTVARTGEVLTEFETTGSDASMMALAHNLQAAVFTAGKGGEFGMAQPIIANYIQPLLKFASKSPRYGELLMAAYKLGNRDQMAAPNPDAERLRAFDAFSKLGAPIPKDVVGLLPGYTPQTGEQETMAQGTPTGRLAGQDQYSAYRAQPTALQVNGPRGPQTVPIDANGMVEITRMVEVGQMGARPVRVKVPWQQATSMNLGANWSTSMAQGTPTGSGFYPVKAIYGPGQSPFVNVAEPMAPPPPPPNPAPLLAAPAPVPVNLGGPGPLPGGSFTPGVNTALLERQRAFAGGGVDG